MKYVCPCGYEYDPAVGDPDNGIAPGTKFEDLPDTWVCPECGAPLAPDTQPREGGEVELWMKRGNNSYYSLTTCTGCKRQWFTRYKTARRDGLHWAFARCHEVPAPDAVAKWNKQKRMQLERMKKRDEKSAE